MIVSERDLGILEKAIEGYEVPKYFGGDYHKNSYNVLDELENLVLDNINNEDFEIKNGVSKGVLVLDQCNVVLKIPFNGEIKYNSFTGEIKFFPFSQANDLNERKATKWDYCENEVLKYERAKEAGLGHFFASVKKYREIKGYPVYIQEKVIPFAEDNEIRCSSAYAKQKYRPENFPFRMPDKWAELLYDFYEEEEVGKFMEYLYRNRLVNDLHADNLGFNDEGRPVLIDWADWRECGYCY